MRDPAAIWTPPPDWATARLVRGDWQARAVPGLHQTLVSGALDRAAADLAPGVPEIGLWGIAGGCPYLVRIARDRALLVTEPPAGAPDGWHPQGWAASELSGGWLVMDLSGPAAAEIVRESTAADLDAGSPSAAVRFAGIVGVLVYRTAPGTVRLHVERGLAPYLWRWLETRIG